MFCAEKYQYGCLDVHLRVCILTPKTSSVGKSFYFIKQAAVQQYETQSHMLFVVKQNVLNWHFTEERSEKWV